jgi:hypothetical protein
MNDERSDQKRRLLNEVFSADSLDAFSGQVKQRALAEFRRARLLRRVASISSAAAVVAVLIAFLFRGSERKTTRVTIVPAATDQGPQPALQTKSPAKDASLTDEQLLALFPADSCFIAEVEGRKTLVFRSPELRQKYLH